MIKHVGKHNDKKVVILYRKVPDEDWMTLLVYSEHLPQAIHDDVMRVLESPVGQNEESLADALFREIASSGQNLLHTLHHAGHIKKVPTSQVMMMPMPGQKVRLDTLNELLDKLAKGEDAAAELRKIDDSAGMGKGKTSQLTTDIPAVTGVLSDADIANQRRTQATKMEAEAAVLLAEATRLKSEAEALSPTVVPVETVPVTVHTETKPKTTVKKVTRKNVNAQEKSKETPV